MTRSTRDSKRRSRAGNDQVLGPEQSRPPDRHILLGVSHSSDDPSRHRIFEVRATFNEATGGWVARVGEQNLNEQRGAWGPLLTDEELARVWPSAAACLGHAVTTIITAVDRGADTVP